MNEKNAYDRDEWGVSAKIFRIYRVKEKILRSSKYDGETPDMSRTLLEWFNRNQRSLPWRREPRDPYRVWVSEIMLQQTQVKTVVDYFTRWMAHFPDVRCLAHASLDEVLKQWEGLGYYSRARLMHRAAGVIVETYRGSFPSTAREMLSLPGIGPYTAAAVASFCFGEQVIAVDGNVRRVASRLFAIDRKPTRRVVEHRLAPLFRGRPAGRMNEALMEIGALVCRPSRPACADCPLHPFCLAFRKGAVAQYPVRGTRKKPPHLERQGLVILREREVFLRKRPETEMLGGLWGIPLVEEGSVPLPNAAPFLEEVRHAYSHFSITVRPVVIDAETFSQTGILAGGKFVPLDRLATLALSGLDHKVLSRLDLYLSNGNPPETSQNAEA